nr:hypothetical protein [Tanacetum cinerariifolium]
TKFNHSSSKLIIMSTLKFADVYNLVTVLSKPTESEGFEQIVDFFNANPIKCELTVNPTVYTSCIEQFWTTGKAKTVNGKAQLQALVDEKKVIITESTVRIDLQLEDAEGVDCLPNAFIFKQLTQIGVHHVSSTRGHDMFMLKEKDYPLPNAVMILMLSGKLQVEEDNEMARDLVMKIFMEANKPKSRSLDTSSK